MVSGLKVSDGFTLPTSLRDKNPCRVDKGDVGVWISKRALTTTRRHTTQLMSNRNNILFPI
jgi:hypothetical protein